MFFSAVNFAARWSGLAALMALGLPAAAQQTIQFSKPLDDDPAGKANAFLPPTARHDPSVFNAPVTIFGANNAGASFDVLPGSPPPVFSAAQALQWQKLIEERKNWTLMTPEEILGIPTPEKILGIVDPNDDPNLSADDRYLKRQQRQSDIGASNAWHRADAPLWQKRDDAIGGEFQPADGTARLPGMLEGSHKARTSNLLFDQHFDGAPDSASAQKTASAWNSPFELPDPIAKKTPEQLAGMERFHAIMAGPVPEKPPQSGGLFAPPVLRDPNMQQMPAFNPAGTSFTPLGNDIGKPTGLMPLAGVTGPHLTPAKKTTPLVQPPPWTQDSLQNSALPQRQF